jgi:1,4-dihydroxy-2-naphthoate polyprenyltransferase
LVTNARPILLSLTDVAESMASTVNTQSTTTTGIGKRAAWLLAARPKTLPAALAPVLLSQSMALSAPQFSLTLALVILLCALSLQIAVNLANDLFDFQSGVDDPDRLGPARAALSGWLSLNELRSGLALALLMATLSGAWLVLQGGWPFALLGIASILAALAYSAGPFPLASNALGEFTVFLFFGLLAVAGSYYLQQPQLDSRVWIAACQMGSLTAAIMLVNNIRDITTDSRAGKRTLAVLLGPATSRLLYALLVLLPFALLLSNAETRLSLAWLAIVPAILLVRLLYQRQGRILNRQLAQTALLCMGFALLRSVEVSLKAL